MDTRRKILLHPQDHSISTVMNTCRVFVVVFFCTFLFGRVCICRVYIVQNLPSRYSESCLSGTCVTQQTRVLFFSPVTLKSHFRLQNSIAHGSAVVVFCLLLFCFFSRYSFFLIFFMKLLTMHIS